MFKAFFFDMDGVLLNSMPNHVIAWDRILSRYGISFQPRDCYANEGRTSRDFIRILASRSGVFVPDERLEMIYHEKTEFYHSLGLPGPIPGVAELLDTVAAYRFHVPHSSELADGDADRTPQTADYPPQIWVVTGGGQPDLFDQLDRLFPGIFSPERMITANDISHGKPDPEPYLKAWERSGLDKKDCCIVENAPLGCQAGFRSGIFTAAVNTGPLTDGELYSAGAERVFPNMFALRNWLQLIG